MALIQNEYSMLWRGPETGVMPLCEELGIGFVCWSPLGMGFLAGGVNAASRFVAPDFRAVSPRFAPDVLPANMALSDLVRAWAQRKNVTPAQLSLAWLLAKKPWIVPIPGTTNAAHMTENLGAASIAFSADELLQLNASVAAVRIQAALILRPHFSSDSSHESCCLSTSTSFCTKRIVSYFWFQIQIAVSQTFCRVGHALSSEAHNHTSKAVLASCSVKVICCWNAWARNSTNTRTRAAVWWRWGYTAQMSAGGVAWSGSNCTRRPLRR
ncbi:MAG: aldo/keto reductase [Comamonadaceae bacterium]|nr:MAG: aldo/keto reductase [Comamonadaceae bacterium]